METTYKRRHDITCPFCQGTWIETRHKIQRRSTCAGGLPDEFTLFELAVCFGCGDDFPVGSGVECDKNGVAK